MTPAIVVDAETYAFLRGFATARGKPVGEVVRDLAGLDPLDKPASSPVPAALRESVRKPKTRLDALKKAGVLAEGETVHLRDFRGQLVAGAEARVMGERLVWQGKVDSMSGLASRLLGEHGYKAESVRGPAVWYTSGGKSIMQLWEDYLLGQGS